MVRGTRRSVHQRAHARRRAGAAARAGRLAARAGRDAHPRPARRRAVALHRLAARLRLGVRRPRRVVLGGRGRAVLQRGLHRDRGVRRRAARATRCAPTTRPASTYPAAHRARAHGARVRAAGRFASRARPTIVVGQDSSHARRARLGHDRRGRQRGASSSPSATSPPRISPRCARRCAPRGIDGRRRRATDATAALDSLAGMRLADRCARCCPSSRSRRRTRSASCSSRRSRSRRPASARADSAQARGEPAAAGVGRAGRRLRRARRQRPVAPRLRVAAHDRHRARRDAPLAGLPALLRRAADRRRGRHDPQSHEGHARGRATSTRRRARSTRRARCRATSRPPTAASCSSAPSANNYTVPTRRVDQVTDALGVRLAIAAARPLSDGDAAGGRRGERAHARRSSSRSRARPSRCATRSAACSREDVVSPVSLPPWDNASMDGFAVRAADVRGASAAQPRAAARWSRPSPRDGAPTRAVGARRGRAHHDRRARARRAPTRWCAWRTPMRARSSVADPRRSRRGRATSARAARMSARGRAVLRAGTATRRARRSACSPRWAAPRRWCIASRASPSSPRATSSCPSRISSAVLAGDRIVSSNSYSLDGGGAGRGRRARVARHRAGRSRARSPPACALRRGATSSSPAAACPWATSTTRAQVVDALGGELSLWRVRMRPGAPLGFGRLFGVPWLGLPGNPVSALVTFELFARPILRTLAGHRRPHRRTVPVTLRRDVQLTRAAHALPARGARGDGRRHAARARSPARRARAC